MGETFIKIELSTAKMLLPPDRKTEFRKRKDSSLSKSSLAQAM